MKKNFFVPLVAGLAMLTAAGCASSNAEALYEAEKAQDLAEAGKKVCEGLLEAFKGNDYKSMKLFMVPELSAQYPENVFNQSRNDMQKTLGEISDYEYLAQLKMPILKNMVYRVTFKRTASDKSVIEQEVLFRVLLSESKGKVRAMSFVFF